MPGLNFKWQVPGLFRWLCERYPQCVIDALEELPKLVDGVYIEPDLCQPNANGEFDNLYLDMNGIIHPACHPEDQQSPSSEEDMFLAIYKYIDRIFSIARPRKLLFMAIDGVAPRAKLNQQRARRFKSAKEMEEKKSKEMNIYESKCYRAAGKPDEELPKMPTFWDHNVITPGTPFMHKLSEYLRFYILDRLSNHPAWKDVAVILSDASVPGEGEHKIMEFIRSERARPDYDPNTRHAIHGKDADLIMLCLATHEPHFTILREQDARRGARPRLGPTQGGRGGLPLPSRKDEREKEGVRRGEWSKQG